MDTATIINLHSVTSVECSPLAINIVFIILVNFPVTEIKPGILLTE